MNYPLSEWPLQYKAPHNCYGCNGYSNYSIGFTGSFIKKADDWNVLLAEAVGAFEKPKTGSIKNLHGPWPADIGSLPMNGVEVGTMNMTLFDGSVHSVKNWANSAEHPEWYKTYGSKPGDYYWPYNDRTPPYGWGFWWTFDAYFD